MKRCHRCIIAIATILTAVGCGSDSTAPIAEVCSPETTSFTATVSSGRSVVFDWEPTCPMAMVLVEEDGSDMWAIADDEGDNNVWDGPDEANLITPPVTYGVVPAVAGEPLQTRGPLPLAAGVTYDLVLIRVLSAGGLAQCPGLQLENACAVAVHPFTR